MNQLEFFDTKFFEPQIEFQAVDECEIHVRRAPLQIRIRSGFWKAAATLAISSVFVTGDARGSSIVVRREALPPQDQSIADRAAYGIAGDMSIRARAPNALAERLKTLKDAHRGALRHASSWSKSLATKLPSADMDRFLDAHVSVSPEDAIVFEWWQGDRKLTVYIFEREALFVQVWGTDIDLEMVEGNADDTNAILSGWSWLKTV